MAEERPPFWPEETAPDDEPLRAYDLPAEPVVRRTRRKPPPDAALQYSDEPPSSGYGCADVVTAFFILLSVGIVSLTILLIAHPHAPINPFPPPTPLALLVLATPEPTLTPSATFTPEPPTLPPPTEPPTATMTETPIPTATETPTPTITPTPVVGGIVTLPPTAAALESSPALRSTRSPYPFSLNAIRYQAHDGSEGCRWQSLAGLVLNMQGQPRTREEGSLTVRITSADGNIDEFHYTGEQPKFGPSGFEAFLGTTPRVGDYTVQLLGITGMPISEKVTVQARSGCDENVVVVEFIQNYIY
ncbi:MAG: hypothetical protein J7551_09185 [Chloroflexi bacterium]|nr:hypothetical protein [Chloroflexota bacterium]